MSVRRRTPFATIPEWVVQAEISSHAVRLWCALDRFAGLPHGAIPSRETLAREWLHTSTDTLDRAKAELIQIGALTVEERPGKPNEYILEETPTLRTGAQINLRTGAERKKVRKRELVVSLGEEALPPSAAESRAALWDALSDATGIVPAAHGERSRWGMSVSELLALGATPDEVLVRAERFRERYPGATCTDRAIVNRWGELANGAARTPAKRFGRGVTADELMRRKG